MRNEKPCLRCGKMYYHMTGLKYHLLNRMKPCEGKYIKLSGSEIMEDYYKYLEIYNDICNPKPKLKLKNGTNEDNEIIESSDNSKKQNKLVMKKKGNSTKQQINNMIKNLNNDVSNDIKNVSNVKRNAITGNHNNFIDQSIDKSKNQNNIYITVNSFGDEDVSHLTRSDWNKIINKKLDAIPELTKRIHIDQETNHNVLINSIKDGHGKIFNGEELVIVPIKGLLEDIVTQMADKLYDYVVTNKVSKLKQIKVNEVIEKLEEDNSKLLKRNARDIKCMMANAKTVMKETLKKLQSDE